MEGEAVAARPETLFHQAARTVRHHQRIATVAGVVLVLCVAVVLIKTGERIKAHWIDHQPSQNDSAYEFPGG